MIVLFGVISILYENYSYSPVQAYTCLRISRGIE